MIADFQALAAKANQELEEVYSLHLPEWKELLKEQRSVNRTLSVPCFLEAKPAYFAARVKILFVGQETHGWWTNWEEPDPTSPIGPLLLEELSVSHITDFYSKVRQYLLNHKGPYWDALRLISKELHLDAIPASYLYSNIFPCDVDRRRAPDNLLDIFRRWAILPREVEILRPNWVVFFCGPNYLWNLRAYFGETAPLLTKKEPISEYNPRGRSWRGLVTYHPAALRRLKLKSVIEDIIAKTRG